VQHDLAVVTLLDQFAVGLLQLAHLDGFLLRLDLHLVLAPSCLLHLLPQRLVGVPHLDAVLLVLPELEREVVIPADQFLYFGVELPLQLFDLGLQLPVLLVAAHH
jgi:hypothetical protein